MTGSIRSALARAILSTLAIALLLALAWAARLDHLRSGYKLLSEAQGALLARVSLALPEVDRPKLRNDLPDAIGKIARERENARRTVAEQSASIRRLESETERLAALSAERRRIAEATIRQRDEWIRRAEAAETRTARMSAEQEMEECNAVLDALFAAGF
jgi:uncharacterized protein involved in exopolysaccharide biosynthesis